MGIVFGAATGAMKAEAAGAVQATKAAGRLGTYVRTELFPLVPRLLELASQKSVPEASPSPRAPVAKALVLPRIREGRRE